MESRELDAAEGIIVLLAILMRLGPALLGMRAGPAFGRDVKEAVTSERQLPCVSPLSSKP
jgi:hypothetical protein